MPSPNHTPHHTFSPTSLLSFGRLSLLFLSFCFFSLYWNTHTLSSTFTCQPHSKPHHLTIIFPTRSLEKYIGTPKHLHHFFEVKVLISFDGYYVLVWGYFTQAFIMIFMWFKSFGNDILVFICMAFSLGGCIWWVSSWFLQWWLSKTYYGEYNVYWLFGAS